MRTSTGRVGWLLCVTCASYRNWWSTRHNNHVDGQQQLTLRMFYIKTHPPSTISSSKAQTHKTSIKTIPQLLSPTSLLHSFTIILLFLIFSSLVTSLNALKEPSSTIAKFSHMPSKLIYFEDTPIILSHDSILRQVWRSTDEGKTWNLISAVPSGDAWLVVEHSWDNRVAFILSRGSKHWRTINRGDSWQSFTTSDQPSISGSPLAFHSTKWNWILFSGQKCESLGSWRGKLCYDEASVFFPLIYDNFWYKKKEKDNDQSHLKKTDLGHFRCIRHSAKNDDPAFH